MGLALCVVGMGLGRGGEYFFLVEPSGWIRLYLRLPFFRSMISLYADNDGFVVSCKRKGDVLVLFVL